MSENGLYYAPAKAPFKRYNINYKRKNENKSCKGSIKIEYSNYYLFGIKQAKLSASSKSGTHIWGIFDLRSFGALMAYLSKRLLSKRYTFYIYDYFFHANFI